MNGVLAKIGGWAAFGLSLLAGIGANGTPHGWAAWLAAIGTLASAIGIHAASNVGQIAQPASNSIATAVKQ